MRPTLECVDEECMAHVGKRLLRLGGAIAILLVLSIVGSGAASACLPAEPRPPAADFIGKAVSKVRKGQAKSLVGNDWVNAATEYEWTFDILEWTALSGFEEWTAFSRLETDERRRVPKYTAKRIKVTTYEDRKPGFSFNCLPLRETFERFVEGGRSHARRRGDPTRKCVMNRPFPDPSGYNVRAVMQGSTKLYKPLTISAISSPASVGFKPTRTPAAASASILP
jgi:hypothetical protein